MSSPVLIGQVKSALLRGWRERWPDERWSIAIKRHFPHGSNGDSCQLAGTIVLIYCVQFVVYLLNYFIISRFKRSADVLDPFLCQLFNLSLQHGCVPSSFKVSYITPLLKKIRPRAGRREVLSANLFRILP